MLARSLPATISDSTQPSWSNTSVPGLQEFDNYHSQTAYRGGSSQVALGQDQAGNLLIAAMAYYGFAAQASNNRSNYVERASVRSTTAIPTRASAPILLATASTCPTA